MEDMNIKSDGDSGKGLLSKRMSPHRDSEAVNREKVPGMRHPSIWPCRRVRRKAGLVAWMKPRGLRDPSQGTGQAARQRGHQKCLSGWSFDSGMEAALQENESGSSVVQRDIREAEIPV